MRGKVWLILKLDVEMRASKIKTKLFSRHGACPKSTCRTITLQYPFPLSCSVNEVACIDHFYLDSVRLLHCMDVSTRFSAVFILSSASIDDGFFGFEACYLSHFWHPVSIHVDKAFAQGSFSEYLKDCDVPFLLMPPLRHSKNPLESKNCVIWSIFLKLQTATPDTGPSLLTSCRCYFEFFI